MTDTTAAKPNAWAVLLNPQLIAMVVAGIQAIHGDAVSGADKKTLAMESLGLGVAAASQVPLSTEQQGQAGAAANVASLGIDAAVAAFKLAGAFGFKKSSATSSVGSANVSTAKAVPPK